MTRLYRRLRLLYQVLGGVAPRSENANAASLPTLFHLKSVEWGK